MGINYKILLAFIAAIASYGIVLFIQKAKKYHKKYTCALCEALACGLLTLQEIEELDDRMADFENGRPSGNRHGQCSACGRWLDYNV